MAGMIPNRLMRERNPTYLQAVLRNTVPSLNFGAAITWTAMPAALNDLYSGTVRDAMKEGYGAFPATYFNFCGIAMNITGAGSAGATVKVQYSIDSGANYNDIPGASFSISTTGQKLVQFALPADAKGVQDLYIRVMGINGNGVAGPIFGVNAGSNGIFSGTQPINIVINLDPPIFSAGATRYHRQDCNFNFFWSFSTLTWTNMPLAETEWFGVTTRRITCDFSNPGSEMVRLTFNMDAAGAANAVMKMQYSLNAGASWQYIDSETGNTGCPCNIGATGWRISSNYVKVDQAAKVAGGTLCRLVGSGGDGAADPTFTGGQTGKTQCCRFDPAS